MSRMRPPRPAAVLKSRVLTEAYVVALENENEALRSRVAVLEGAYDMVRIVFGVTAVQGAILSLLIFFHWSAPLSFTPLLQDPAENLSKLIWPALAVGYRYMAVATRMTRSAVLEVLREDYVRTARAKGLAEQAVVRRHALRNALLPVVTVIGLEFAFLIGGLVVTEQVFNLNGIGKLLVEAVSHRDYTLTQALIMLTASAFILVNFLTDLLYLWLDPRISYA